MVGGGAWVFKEEPFLPNKTRGQLSYNFRNLVSNSLLVLEAALRLRLVVCSIFVVRRRFCVNIVWRMHHLDSTGHLDLSVTRIAREAFSSG